MAVERTFIILKPDCMEKKLAGSVLERLFSAGLKCVGLKMTKLDEKILNVHYAHLLGKPFFPSLVAFMSRTPVILGVFEGEGAVSAVRQLCGPTDSTKAPKGTIRGDWGTSVQENIIHASDSTETAEAEIARFFSKSELY